MRAAKGGLFGSDGGSVARQHAQTRGPRQRPSSAPMPPQGAPGGSGRLETPQGERPGHWAARHRLGCSGPLPLESPIPLTHDHSVTREGDAAARARPALPPVRLGQRVSGPAARRHVRGTMSRRRSIDEVGRQGGWSLERQGLRRTTQQPTPPTRIVLEGPHTAPTDDSRYRVWAERLSALFFMYHNLTARRTAHAGCAQGGRRAPAPPWTVLRSRSTPRAAPRPPGGRRPGPTDPARPPFSFTLLYPLSFITRIYFCV